MATSTKLTNLELQGLQAITTSDFYENGRDSIVWDFSVYDDFQIRGKARSGIFSSLVQKGLIVVTEKEKPFYTNLEGQKIRNPYYSRDCNFGTLQITELGYQVLDEMELIDDNGRFK